MLTDFHPPPPPKTSPLLPLPVVKAPWQGTECDVGGEKSAQSLIVIRNTLQANGEQRQRLTNFQSNYLVINAPVLGDGCRCSPILYLMKLPVLLPKQLLADLRLLR